MSFSQLKRQVLFLTACLILAGAFCGCGGGPKEAVLAQVFGVVKINGKPAANIMVQFLPEVGKGEDAPTSTAVTNEQGEFDLVTDTGKQGAAVGKSKVLFFDTAEERPAQGEQAVNPPRISPSHSVLGPLTQSVEVKTDNPLVEFDLKN